MKGFYIKKKIDLNKKVLSLKLLKDKRLAAGNNFYILNIYDLKRYKPDIIISGIFEGFITNINQLKNENLIVSSSWGDVKIIKITKNTFNVIQSIKLRGGIFEGGGGFGGIYIIHDKIIELNNNDLAITIYQNDLIQLWKKENENYFKYDSLIEKNYISEIFEIKPNLLLSDNDHHNHLVVWDLKNKQKISILNGIKVNGIFSDNKTCFINEKSIAYCGRSNLYIIEINNLCVIQKIKILKEELISICLFSKNILFVGGINGILYQYKIKGKKITLKDKKNLKFKNFKEISSIVKLDENAFAFGCCSNKLFFMQKKNEGTRDFLQKKRKFKKINNRNFSIVKLENFTIIK
jgi:hypothetical protein